MGIENLARKGLASKYHTQCLHTVRIIIKIEQKKLLNEVDKENLIKAVELVKSMIVGDKFLSDISTDKKTENDLMINIELAGIGHETVDTFIRESSYESYPYNVFFERIVKELENLVIKKETNFNLLEDFFEELSNKFYVPCYLVDMMD